MSKTKTMRIAVIAAIMSLMLALSAWVALLPAHAANSTNTGNVDTGNEIRLGSLVTENVGDVAITGQARIRLSQFVQCGDASGDLSNTAQLAQLVTLVDPTQSDGEQHPSHIRTEAYSSGFLTFFFNNSAKHYQTASNWGVGSTLTIAEGFTFGKDGKTCNVTEPIVYTKTAEGWKTGKSATVSLGGITNMAGSELHIPMSPKTFAGKPDDGELSNKVYMKEKVYLTVPTTDGGEDTVIKPSHMRTSQAYGCTLQLYFIGSAYENKITTLPKGTTLTVKKDFWFVDLDAETVGIGNDDIIYTYMDNAEWVIGDGVPVEFDIPANRVTHTDQLFLPIEPFVDTRHINVGSNSEYSFPETYNNGEIVNKNFELRHNGKVCNPSHTRIQIDSQNPSQKNVFKLYFNNDTDVLKNLIAGDSLTIKKEFKYIGVDSKYHGIGNTDKVLVYTAEGWKDLAPATSATLTKENKEFHAGATMQLSYTVNSGAIEPLPTFSTSNSEIATVSKTGVVTGVSAGNVTVTAHFSNITAEVEIEVLPKLSVTGLVADVSGYAASFVKNNVRYIRAYKGEPLELYTLGTESGNTLDGIGGKFVFEDDSIGGTIEDATLDMLSCGSDAIKENGKFTFNKAGATSLTLTMPNPDKAGENITAQIPVWVYETETVEKLNANRVITYDIYLNLYFADVIGGGESVNNKTIGMDENGIKENNIPEDMIVLRVPKLGDQTKKYKLGRIGQQSEKQCIMHFEGFSGTNPAGTLPVGAVLEIRDSFRFYRYIDGDWVAKYKFAEPFAFVWTGSEWADFVADATSFEVAYTELTVPQYSYFAPEVTLTPAGSYIKVQYVSSNTAAVEVKDGKLLAKAAGSAEITAYILSATEQGAKKFTVTVEEAQPEGVELSNNRTFYVEEGGKLDITKVRGKFICGTGSDGKTYYGDDIELTEDNTQFTMPTATGTHSVEVTVTVAVGDEELSAKVNVNVDVQPNREVIIANFALWMNEKNSVGVYFNGTFGNMANVYMKDLTEEQKASVVNFIEFERGGVKGAVLNSGEHTPNYLTHILVASFTFGGSQIQGFEKGDVITLKKGLTFYQWFGSKDANNEPVGEGDYVKVGELKHDIKIKYNGDKFSWHIDPESGAVKEESVTVGLGKTHASNVEITPVYATHGEWYFSVADSTIAKVSTSGLISGLKIGSTKVTATLKDVDGKVIDEVEFTVVVEDVEKEIKITSEKPVNVALGAELDVAALAENFGLKGVVIMASGAEGEAVDLTKARVTGYDSEKNGKQTLTFRVSVNGVSVSGTFVITVGDGGNNGGGEETGCGCGSSAAGVASLTFGAAILAIAFVITLRKRKA